MKSIAPVFFILCAALLVGAAIFEHARLPDKIASHFNGQGAPNGWMSSSAFTVSMIAIGLLIPAFVSGVMYSIRFFPARFLNVPNPAYWRDPKNYRKACDFLFQSSLWFGCAFILWQIAFSHLIVAANQSSPPHLDGGRVGLLTAALFSCTAAWIVGLLLRFLRTDRE